MECLAYFLETEETESDMAKQLTEDRYERLIEKLDTLSGLVYALRTDVTALQTESAKIQGAVGVSKWILQIVLPLFFLWLGGLTVGVYFQAGAASNKLVMN